MQFYRYSSTYYENGPKVTLDTYISVKETAKGYWIELEDDIQEEPNRSWISKSGKKRFAYPTKEGAMVNFKARKRRQIEILKGKLMGAELELDIANDIEV